MSIESQFFKPRTESQSEKQSAPQIDQPVVSETQVQEAEIQPAAEQPEQKEKEKFVEKMQKDEKDVFELYLADEKKPEKSKKIKKAILVFVAGTMLSGLVTGKAIAGSGFFEKHQQGRPAYSEKADYNQQMANIERQKLEQDYQYRINFILNEHAQGKIDGITRDNKLAQVNFERAAELSAVDIESKIKSGLVKDYQLHTLYKNYTNECQRIEADFKNKEYYTNIRGQKPDETSATYFTNKQQELRQLAIQKAEALRRARIQFAVSSGFGYRR